MPPQSILIYSPHLSLAMSLTYHTWILDCAFEKECTSCTRKFMPLLETFIADIFNDIGVIEAPSLTTFVIEGHGNTLFDARACISLSLSSLTKLEVKNAKMDKEELLDTLKSFHNLAHCRLHDIQWVGNACYNNFVALKLEFLSLAWTPNMDDVIQSLIEVVELPSLQTLKLKFRQKNYSFFSSALFTENNESSGWEVVFQNLKHLTIYHANLRSCSFGYDILPSCKNPETLDIKGGNGYNAVTQTFGDWVEPVGENDGQFRYCPRLTELAMTLDEWNPSLMGVMEERETLGCLRKCIIHQPGTLSTPGELSCLLAPFYINRNYM